MSHLLFNPSSANRPRAQSAWVRIALVVLGFGAVLVASTSTPAQPHPDAASAEPVAPCNAPVPPHAEGPPVQLPNGGYCFDGPHPADTKSAAGPPWDNAPGRHTHFYPPVDARLFVLRKDCYHFIGDPQDFGFDGETQGYYGTHPIPGGGWCFMVGGHQHSFSPFSPQFVMVGPWIHWQGEYDANFWSQWPYFSAFYKDLYPRFYGSGQWSKDRKVAPRLPPGAWTNREILEKRTPPAPPDFAAPSDVGATRAPPSPVRPSGKRTPPTVTPSR